LSSQLSIRLALGPARRALRLRKELGLDWTPVCSIDLAERLGVEVRFVAIPSLEGMYLRGPSPRIFVGAERTRGRKAMTVAHELGHHLLGHGTQIQGLLANNTGTTRTREEQEADVFAANLLMPKKTVEAGFRTRGFSLTVPDAFEILVVAGWLGVSYDALVRQMSRSFHFFGNERFETLRKVRPKRLREHVLASRGYIVEGGLADSEVMVVDVHWGTHTIDLQVGDVALVPQGSTVLSGRLGIEGELLRAQAPGIGRIAIPDGGTHFVRSGRRHYAGLAQFRHLEAIDDDLVPKQ
jgi:Zn-dependent peptidase ImmA (M78 family)